MDTATNATTPTRKSRKQLFLVLGAGVLVLLGGALLLAPTIAGSFAPGIIASQASSFVKGKVALGSASFSWGGPQKLTNLTWTDEQGKQIAKASVSTSAGLLGLVSGRLNLGEVEIKDTTLALVRHQDGQLNVQKLLVTQPAGAPTPGTAPSPQASKPIQLPKGLKVKLSIKNVDVTLIDEAGPGGPASPTTVRLANVLGSATIDPSQALKAKLSADASVPAGGEGKIALDIDASNWADASGLVTMDNAQLKAILDIQNLPMAMVDGLAGPVIKDESGKTVPLATALGPTLTLKIDANGNLKDATANLNLVMQRATANGSLRIADGSLTSTQPLAIALKGQALSDLVPALRQALAQAASATAPARPGVDTLPDITISISDLRTKLPQGGAGLDLRGTSATIALETTQVIGSVVTAAGQAPQSMRITPLRATIKTTDLAQTVSIIANTSATLDNQPAGELSINTQLAGLLDAQGAPRSGVPQSVNASVQIRQIATAVAQPFVRALNLDLARDIGPILDLDLKAITNGTPGPSGTSPLDIDLRASAAMLRATGAFTLRDDALVGRAISGAPVMVVEADAAGRLAETITAKGPWKVSAAQTAGGNGKAVVKINWLNLPLAANRSPRMDQADVSVGIDVEQLLLTPVADAATSAASSAPRGSIQIPKFGAGLSLAKGGNATVGMQGQFAYESQQGGIGANFTVPGVIRALSSEASQQRGEWTMADPITLRPVGDLEVVNLPLALASLFVQPPVVDANTGKAGMDVVALLRDIVGPAIVIRVRTTAGDGGALAVNTSADSGQFKFTASANLSETSIAMQSVEMRTTLSPQSAEAVMARLAPEMQDRPRLAAPAQAVFSVQPLLIPLDKDRLPKFAEAGPAKARLTLPGRVLVDNVATSQTQKARVGLEDFTLDVEAPLSSLIAPQAQGKGTAAAPTLAPALAPAQSSGPMIFTLRGNLLGAPMGSPQQVLGQLSGSSTIQLSNAKPESIRADFTLGQLSTQGLDALLGKEGLIVGALGQSAEVRIVANSNADASRADASMSLTAPNFQTTGPLKLRVLPEKFELVEPARFTLRTQPSFVEALLRPTSPAPTSAAPAPQAPALALASETVIDLAITTLVLPRQTTTAGTTPGTPPGTTAAKPPPPDIALALTIPSAVLRTSDNKSLTIANTRVTINPATNVPAVSAGDKPLAFALLVDSVQVQGSQASGKLELTGNLRNLIDSAGVFSMDSAIFDAQGQMPSVPTALVDVLAKKDGLLVEALGPIIELSILAERYPISGKPVAGVAPGLLDIKARSERANASIKGDLTEGVLVCDQPVTANLLEISAAFAGRVVKGLPLLGTFEKKREDRPAMITASGLRVPLSSDLSKLSGQVTIDPGQLRFGAGSEFSQLLNLAKIKSNASIGTRLEPLVVNVTNGVATYAKWRVPLGEFTMETEGTVNLVNRQLDVVTWIPLGALADEAAGIFNTGAGGKLNQILGGSTPVLEVASMLPFRTKGSMDNPQTGPDLELFGKTFLKQLKPENLLEKGLGDLFKGLKKEKK